MTCRQGGSDNVLCTGWHRDVWILNRFLALQTGPQLVCPYCGEEPDMEVGPDEEMPVAAESAKLIQVVKGAEEVERMDTLLSLAVTGGDYAWI